jgi:coenzyme F420 hydrogenase subunit beta
MNCLDLKTSVIDSDLCCGCGACVGVCPADALAIDITRSHEPVIDESKCTDCGLCVDVCPGKGYAVDGPSKKVCGDEIRFDPERGSVIEYLKGHSTDPDIRLNSASGGVATALLIHLLESGQVDAVHVIGLKDERQFAVLTNDAQEIRNSISSKYGVVPMLATLIPNLLKRPRLVAATFTPCQLAGWRLAAKRIPRLRESTVIAIGLFCGYIHSNDVLDGIASSLGIEYPGNARFTDWRYGSYPGHVRFERNDGTEALKRIYETLDISVPFYSLNRCYLCPDGGNWMADMTLGDIHSGGEDETIIVCRTERGRKALESARVAGAVITQEMLPDEVEKSVIRHISRSKLLPAIARNAWLREKNRPAPEFDYDDNSLLRSRKRLIQILWIWKYRLSFWCRKGWRRRFLMKHPSLMERVGHFLYTFPNSIPGWKLLAGGRSLFRR